VIPPPRKKGKEGSSEFSINSCVEKGKSVIMGSRGFKGRGRKGGGGSTTTVQWVKPKGGRRFFPKQTFISAF